MKDLRDEWNVGTKVFDSWMQEVPGTVVLVTKRRLSVAWANGEVNVYDAEHVKFLRRKEGQ